MPTQIPPNATLAILRWSVAGDAEEMLCTLGLTHDPSSTAQEVADDYYLAATGSGSLTPLAALNQPWTFVGTRVYKRLGGDPVFAEHTEPITQTTGGSTALPSNCALLMHKDTGTPGRKGRGRCYFPPALVDEGSVDTNGTITSGVYVTLAAREVVFYNALVSSGLLPVLFHSDGAAPTPITGFRLDTRIATQRQRMRR